MFYQYSFPRVYSLTLSHYVGRVAFSRCWPLRASFASKHTYTERENGLGHCQRRIQVGSGGPSRKIEKKLWFYRTLGFNYVPIYGMSFLLLLPSFVLFLVTNALRTKLNVLTRRAWPLIVFRFISLRSFHFCVCRWDRAQWADERRNATIKDGEGFRMTRRMITENKRKEKGTERASKRKRENKGAGSFGPCACVMKNARAHMKCHWLFSAKKENKEKNSEQKRAEGLELSTKIFQGSIFFGPETYVTTQPRYLRNPKTKVVGQCGTQCGVLIPARNSPRSSGRAIYTPPPIGLAFRFQLSVETNSYSHSNKT